MLQGSGPGNNINGPGSGPASDAKKGHDGQMDTDPIVGFSLAIGRKAGHTTKGLRAPLQYQRQVYNYKSTTRVTSAPPHHNVNVDVSVNKAKQDSKGLFPLILRIIP